MHLPPFRLIVALGVIAGCTATRVARDDTEKPPEYPDKPGASGEVAGRDAASTPGPCAGIDAAYTAGLQSYTRERFAEAVPHLQRVVELLQNPRMAREYVRLYGRTFNLLMRC